MFRGEEPLPNPPSAPGQGVVFLFNGLTFPFEGVVGTGAYRLAQNIRRAGVRAEINRPSAWPDAADHLLRRWPLEQGPVAVYGYRPVPVPCNVREAIHLFVSGAALIPVSALAPKRPDYETSASCRKALRHSG
jgi:hypothetical protein